jgi:broad specificity phosphatase PhoE
MSSKEPKIKLFFIRHAFSCANYKSLKSNIESLLNSFRLDPHLADIGIRDLQRYRNTIRKDINPDYVFSSGLLRAIQTAQILFPESTVNVAPYIGEHGISLGSTPSKPSEQLRYLNPNKVKYLYLGKQDRNNNLDRLFKNRKPRYCKPNFQKFLNWLKRRITLDKDLSIVVVGHSNFMRHMLNDLGMSNSSEKIMNAGVIEMSLSKEGRGFVPYTKGCKPIENVNKEVSYKYPCYGIKFRGIPNPQCKVMNC